MGFFTNALKTLSGLFCQSLLDDDKPQQYPQQGQQEQQQLPHKPVYPQQQPPHEPVYPQQEPPHKPVYPQQQPPHEPVYPQQPQPHYPPTPPSHPPQKHGDQNQYNQQDEHYKTLRAQANEAGDQMAKCFEESHEAYSRGNGALAKELSNQGKEHKKRMETLNREASDWIFIENNKDSKPGEIDLHGLYVKEAIARTDRAVQEAKQRGDPEIRLIVGKGLHSQGGAAKIKPAVEELMQKHQLKAEIDPSNAGVLKVQLNAGGNRGVGPDEITRRLERNDEGCTIM